MPGRIAPAFAVLAARGRPAFIPYLPSGFPDEKESDRLVLALCQEGADLVELGVPFSDPLADGPVVQRASEMALRAGASLRRALRQASRIRRQVATPLVLMSYLNPVLRYGIDAFAGDAAQAGVDGVILVDLPPEEEPALWERLHSSGLESIVMVSPTTEDARLPGIATRAGGYVYVVARLGVTGSGAADPGLESLLTRVRGLTPLPRCLGFGFDPESDLRPFRGRAEGIIVGSALLRALLDQPGAVEREASAREFARAFRSKLAELSAG
jgi:tryptophan synthase alpha chain